MRLIDAPIRELMIHGSDNTQLSVYVAGRGHERMVIAPGLGTNVYCWKYFFEHFSDRYTMVTWDPRGTYRSGLPANEDNLRLIDHVMDMESVCNYLGWQSFVLGGWSMGVQISLEYYHRHPDTVRALLLIHGTFEHVLRTAFNMPGGNLAFALLLHLGSMLHPLVAPAVTRVVGIPCAVDIMHIVGQLAANKDYFRNIVTEFSRLNWRVFWKLLLLLNEHSARPYLREVRVPTLITAGTKDLLTPVRIAEEMHRCITGSVLRVIEGGTHYTLVEFPDELHRAIDDLLATLPSQKRRRTRKGRS
jgi:pimeloyl-ACP methyl ester carboxylesterase